MLSAFVSFIGGTYGLYLGWTTAGLKGELKVTHIFEGLSDASCMGSFLGVFCLVILDAGTSSPSAYAYASFEAGCLCLIGTALGFLLTRKQH